MAEETKVVAPPAADNEIKLFGKWSTNVNVEDMSLQVCASCLD